MKQEEGQIFELRMKAKEQKSEALQKIRFEVNAKFNDSSKKTLEKTLYLKLNEVVLGESTNLITQEEHVTFDGESFKFAKFDFTSDLFTSKGPVPGKSLVLEIMEVDKKKKHKFVGKT